MAVTLTDSEARELYRRAVETTPDNEFASFWNVCREYGAWAASDSEYTRLQCSPKGSGNGPRQFWLTDTQALFIDAAVKQVSNMTGDDAFNSFKFCFMVSAQDKCAIGHFNHSLRKRCRQQRLSAHKVYTGEVALFVSVLRTLITDRLSAMIFGNKSQKNR